MAGDYISSGKQHANPRGKHLTALGTIVFSILVPGTWTVLVPYLLIASKFELFPIEIGPLRFFGLFPITVGIAFYLWCAWGFTFLGKGTPAPIAPPKHLVIKGLYRHVRNPMYVGVLLILFGEALLFESATLFLYAVLAFVIFHTAVVYYEEPTLRRKFADSYKRYCNSVPRWIPRLRQEE
jgi:protein-S-isoprenylcysteine O-methyltransferase Ste14